MIGDEPFLPKPPSKFHEDRGRGKSSWRHDKMQAELLRHQIKFIAHLDYHLVCDANDPKLADLRAEWPHVWAWGVVFDPDTGATR